MLPISSYAYLLGRLCCDVSILELGIGRLEQIDRQTLRDESTVILMAWPCLIEILISNAKPSGQHDTNAQVKKICEGSGSSGGNSEVSKLDHLDLVNCIRICQLMSSGFCGTSRVPRFESRFQTNRVVCDTAYAKGVSTPHRARGFFGPTTHP